MSPSEHRCRPRHSVGITARHPCGRMSTAAVFRFAAAVLPLIAGCEVRDEELTPPSRISAWRPDSLPTSSLLIDGLPAGQEAVAFAESYAAAAEQAVALDRPLLLVFRAGWCRWSGEFARGPLAERRVIAMSRQFICATVDADRDADTCRRFGVSGFPTVLLIDATGTERFRATGISATSALPDAMAGLLGRPRRVDRVADGEASPPR